MVLPGNQKAKYKSLYDRAFKGEAVVENESTEVPDPVFGRSCTLNPIYKNNEVIGASCYSHDITKLILAKEKDTNCQSGSSGDFLKTLLRYLFFRIQTGRLLRVTITPEMQQFSIPRYRWNRVVIFSIAFHAERKELVEEMLSQIAKSGTSFNYELFQCPANQGSYTGMTCR
jgi:hypothetical protein